MDIEKLSDLAKSYEFKDSSYVAGYAYLAYMAKENGANDISFFYSDPSCENVSIYFSPLQKKALDDFMKMDISMLTQLLEMFFIREQDNRRDRAALYRRLVLSSDPNKVSTVATGRTTYAFLLEDGKKHDYHYALGRRRSFFRRNGLTYEEVFAFIYSKLYSVGKEESIYDLLNSDYDALLLDFDEGLDDDKLLEMAEDKIKDNKATDYPTPRFRLRQYASNEIVLRMISDHLKEDSFAYVLIGNRHSASAISEDIRKNIIEKKQLYALIRVDNYENILVFHPHSENVLLMNLDDYPETKELHPSYLSFFRDFQKRKANILTEEDFTRSQYSFVPIYYLEEAESSLKDVKMVPLCKIANVFITSEKTKYQITDNYQSFDQKTEDYLVSPGIISPEGVIYFSKAEPLAPEKAIGPLNRSLLCEQDIFITSKSTAIKIGCFLDPDRMAPHPLNEEEKKPEKRNYYLIASSLIIRMLPQSEVPFSYVLAYLCSSKGRQALESLGAASSKRTTNINISAKNLRQLQIPILALDKMRAKGTKFINEYLSICSSSYQFEEKRAGYFKSIDKLFR